jgi:hypothetical protein
MSGTRDEPRALFGPELSLACDPARLAALLDTCGWPDALAKKKTRDARALALALWQESIPSRSAAALAMATCFAHARARDALSAAAEDARQQGHFDDGRLATALAAAGAPPLDAWCDTVPIDLALAVALASARAPDALTPIVQRAEQHLARRLPPLVPWEYAARSSSPRACTPEDAAKILGDVARARAPWVDVWPVALEAPRERGVAATAVVVAVLRAAAPTGACAVDAKNGPARARVASRALAVDRVTIDLSARRVIVTTAEPSLAPAYAEALGAALWNDARALVGHAAVTLKKLQSLGSAGLAKLPMPASIVARPIVIALEHDDRAGARKQAHGPRAFASLEADMRRGGYLFSATLRFEVRGASRPVDAWVALPNRLSISDPRFAVPVRAALDALGVFSPGSLADDIVTLAPWTHPEWRWRDVLGDDAVDALRGANLLVTARVSSRGARPIGDGERKLGAGLRGFALDNARDAGRVYAIASDESVRPRTVPANSLAMLALDNAALDAKMRASLGAQAPPRGGGMRALPSGFRDVGVFDVGATRIRFVRLVRAVSVRESKKLGDALRRAAKGQHVVALVPEGRTLFGAAAEVPLTLAQQLGAAECDGVLLAAASALGLEDAMPSWCFATRERPLVVDAANEAFSLGVVALDLTPNQRSLILALTRAHAMGRAMGPKDLGLAISPGSTIPDQVTRKACMDLDARVARSFRDAGATLRAEWSRLVTQDRTHGYRLAVGFVVR